MDTILLQKIAGLPMDQGLLNQAVGFFNAASRCFAEVAISPCINNSPMTPGVVCGAFSLELYLKLLRLLATGEQQRGHKLSELFAGLPQDLQRRIAEKYGNSEIAVHIDQMSAAFVAWRYEHEHDSLAINPAALKAVATACHLVARELRPELTVFGENTHI